MCVLNLCFLFCSYFQFEAEHVSLEALEEKKKLVELVSVCCVYFLQGVLIFIVSVVSCMISLP